MTVKLSRWGNSLAVRIPTPLAAEAAITEGEQLNIRFQDGALQLIPAEKPVTLEELVSGITKENCHSEIQTGTPAGNEAW